MFLDEKWLSAAAHEPDETRRELNKDKLNSKNEDEQRQQELRATLARMHENRVTARVLLKAVEKEFAAWKAEHVLKPAKALLEATFPSMISPSAGTSTSVPDTVDGLPLSFTKLTISGPPPPEIRLPDADRDDIMFVCEYGDDGKPLGDPQETQMNVVELPKLEDGSEPSYEPCQTYQYCAPLSTNISMQWNGDGDKAPFMPSLESESTFPHDEYMATFDGGGGWLKTGRDGLSFPDTPNPDRELIVYETIRRLHFGLNLSRDEIDDVLKNVDGMACPPLRIGDTGLSGFLWASEQRDAPNIVWADGHTAQTAPQLSKDVAGFVPSDDDPLMDRIRRNHRIFCANVDCVVPLCRLHEVARFASRSVSDPGSRQYHQSIIIGKSQWGFGAFAGENITKGDLIGEYVGEVFFNVDMASTKKPKNVQCDAELEEDLDSDSGSETQPAKEEPLVIVQPGVSRSVIDNFVGTNYTWGIGTDTIDSRPMGNPTRFLNDSKPGEPNCEAEGRSILF
ncbi:hypothetical protein HMN09_00041400 [Mycena chlorophos]|uniref:SET domain-containing protein n=1 Tax=Mycena chlorophos TaxID=658473 RepID=A0A8H6WS66_MYCCL|nr:hypothetical protein HMN09_00041400 [Mycena chlorophos]